MQREQQELACSCRCGVRQCCRVAGRTLSNRPSFNESSKSSPARVASRSNMHEASLPNYKSGAEMSAPTSRRQTSDGDRPKIHPMPQNPLSLLKKLTAYIKVQNMQTFGKLFSLLGTACCLQQLKLPILHNSCFLLRKLKLLASRTKVLCLTAIYSCPVLCAVHA